MNTHQKTVKITKKELEYYYQIPPCMKNVSHHDHAMILEPFLIECLLKRPNPVTGGSYWSPFLYMFKNQN